MRTLLSDFLRHDLGLTGTHVGCEHGACGACTVLVDGVAVRSCLMLAAQADGREVTTVEGLARDGELSPPAGRHVGRHGLQCGFCTPGILMTVEGAARAGDDVEEKTGRSPRRPPLPVHRLPERAGRSPTLVRHHGRRLRLLGG